jgi:hypothetical protein
MMFILVASGLTTTGTFSMPMMLGSVRAADNASATSFNEGGTTSTNRLLIVQLWSEIATAARLVAHDLATLFQPQQVARPSFDEFWGGFFRNR